MQYSKVFIAYYCPIHDGDGGFYTSWDDKTFIAVYTSEKLLLENINETILNLKGNPYFFTPKKEDLKWNHPKENVFTFTNDKASYVWDYEECDLITGLEIFK